MANRYDISVGRAHAITREELARLWHCDEREARAQIAKWRTTPSDDGYAILSSSHPPAGYWRSSDEFEIREFVRETESRARNTIRMLREARAALKSTAG